METLCSPMCDVMLPYFMNAAAVAVVVAATAYC
jgi:hypothetical protein